MTNCNNNNCECCNNCCKQSVQFGTTIKDKPNINYIAYGDINNGYNQGDLLDANAIIDLIVSLTQDIITWKYIGYDE